MPHDFFNGEEPEQFHWKWEERLALVLVLLWVIAAFVGSWFYL